MGGRGGPGHDDASSSSSWASVARVFQVFSVVRAAVASGSFRAASEQRPLLTTRDPALWPFSVTSPWNFPLGSNAQFAMPVAFGSPSGKSLPHGFSSMGVNAAAWSIPVYVSSTTDPLRNHTRDDRNAQGGCSVPHYCHRAFPTNSFLRHTPRAAEPADGSNGHADAHLVLISPDHRTAMEGFGCRPDGFGGFRCAGSAVNVDLRGNGWDCCGVWGGDGHPAGTGGNGTAGLWLASGAAASPRPIDVGTGARQLRMGTDGFCLAAATSSLGGLIRAGELQNGIHHALQVIADPSRWNRNARGRNHTGPSFVWPASSSDDPDNDQFATSGNLYEGALLAIPPTVDIERLKFRSATNSTKLRVLRNIATAFQRYGGYGIDSGGVNGVQLRLEYTARHELPMLTGDFLADLGDIATQLRVVTNSFNPENGGQPIGGVRLNGGDGRLLATLAPPFDLLSKTDDAGSGAGRRELPGSSRHGRVISSTLRPRAHRVLRLTAL
jgi:hypothetical protein